MELESSPRVILFLFSRENWSAAERPNTPFFSFFLHESAGRSRLLLTLIFTEVAEDHCQRAVRVKEVSQATVSFCLTQPSVSHCRTAHFSNKMPW